MTSGHKVSLWKPGGHSPHPCVPPEGWKEKGPTGEEKDKSEGKQNRKERAKGRRKWVRVSKMKRGVGGEKRGVSQNISEGKRKGVSGWAVGGGVQGHWVELKLVRSQSWVLGMKTGRAVCCSQAWAPSPPQICTLIFSPPPASITRCIPPPDRLSQDSATLSNRPDGFDEIQPTVRGHLNHPDVTALLSCFIPKHSFAKVAPTKLAEQDVTSSRSVMRRRWLNPPENKS